jgi:hypothetical protein
VSITNYPCLWYLNTSYQCNSRDVHLLPSLPEKEASISLATNHAAILFGAVEGDEVYDTRGMGSVIVGKTPTNEANILGMPKLGKWPAPPKGTIPGITDTG